MNERRGFIKTAIAAVLALFGVKAASGKTTHNNQQQTGEPLTLDSIRGRLLCGRPTEESHWFPERVQFADLHYGAGTCSMGAHSDPNTEGFRAIITGKDHTYHVVAQPHYLGCTMTCREPLPGEDWLRGSDLSDGKLTIETWRKIVADIEHVEKYGTKYRSAERKKETAK